MQLEEILHRRQEENMFSEELQLQQTSHEISLNLKMVY